MKYLVLIFLFSSLVRAEVLVESPKFPTEDSSVVPVLVKPEDSPIEEVVEEANPTTSSTPILDRAKNIQEELSETRDLRRESRGSVMVGHQLITSWIPSKKTIS